MLSLRETFSHSRSWPLLSKDEYACSGYEPVETRGFTLVELLTVISIVFLLMAILIPVVRAIQERASEVECSSRLRNLHQATTLYQAEHGGFLPPNHAHSGAPADKMWSVVIRPYFQIADLSTSGSGTRQFLELITCPAADESEKPTRWWESNYAAGVSFGTDGVPRNPNQGVKNPGSTLMYIDSNSFSRSLYRTPRPWTTVGYRHDGKTNMVFFDGHLETRTKAEIPESLEADLWGLYEVP